MCNQRERLIGYVYDECDATERAAVQRHLDACAECRDEIAALRSVREDLQAFDVPDHESVWRPFAPAPAPAWWNQVPRWALAAAAGVMLASGAIGGAASYALMGGRPVTAAPGVMQTTSGVTVNDIQALERRLETRIRTEVDQLNTRVQLASSRQLTPEMEASLHKAFDQQLAQLRRNGNEQLDLLNLMNANLGQYQKTFDTRQAVLSSRVERLAAVLEQSR